MKVMEPTQRTQRAQGKKTVKRIHTNTSLKWKIRHLINIQLTIFVTFLKVMHEIRSRWANHPTFAIAASVHDVRIRSVVVADHPASVVPAHVPSVPIVFPSAVVSVTFVVPPEYIITRVVPPSAVILPIIGIPQLAIPVCLTFVLSSHPRNHYTHDPPKGKNQARWFNLNHLKQNSKFVGFDTATAWVTRSLKAISLFEKPRTDFSADILGKTARTWTNNS